MVLRGNRCFIFALLIFLCGLTYSQGYFNNWYFGNGASINFNSGPPVVTNNSSLHTVEGTACVSDFQGNLLFYTDGDTIWNKNHIPMPNGTGLMGNTSTSQSALIVRVPGDTMKYYVFTMQEWSFAGDLRYSIVDMTLNNGNGDIAMPSKNILLGTGYTEKLVAAKGNCGVWILTHKRGNNVFNAHFINSSGISAPVISNAGSIHVISSSAPGLTGVMKVSPNNQKIALATLTGVLEVLDFNNSTGVVSNAITLPVFPNQQPWGVCFSPDNSFLYAGEGSSPATAFNKLYQFNITSNVQSIIASTKILVGSPTTNLHIVFDIQIGPDNKIYVTRSGLGLLDVINNPNAAGVACNYLSGGVNIGGARVTVGLPNALRFSDVDFKVKLGKDTTICQGQSLTLNAGPANSYSWSTGSTASVINVSSPGIYWVLANNGTCSDPDSIVVSVVPNPTINLGNDITICQGQTVTLNAGSASSYSWSTGATTSTLNVSLAGTYWVQGNNANCSDKDSINVSVINLPNIFLGNDTTLCQGQSLTLNGSAAGTYSWSNGSTSSSINVSSSGIYWLQASNAQCSDHDSITVNFLPVPNVDLGKDTTICEGQVLTLNGGLANSYLWSNGTTLSTINVFSAGNYWVQANNSHCFDIDSINVGIINLPNSYLGNDTSICSGQSLILSGSIANSYLWSNGSTASSINISTSGIYWLQASNSQCLSVDSINVSVVNPPNVILGNDTIICQGQTLVLTGPVANSFLWSNGSVNSNLSISNSGTYWLQAGNANCFNTDSINITVNDLPMVNLGNDTTVCENKKLILFTTSVNSHTWIGGATTPTIEVDSPGIFWVIVNDGKCTNTDSISIMFSDCKKGFFLPQGFTPNGDGINDYFVIKKPDEVKLNLLIYNRWGEKVYEKDEYDNTWNGYPNINSFVIGHDKLPQGTYFVIVEILRETKEVITGFVVLQY